MRSKASLSLQLLRYLGVVPLLALVTWIKLVLMGPSNRGSPFSLYGSAVLLVSMLWGRKPGLAATAMAAVTGTYLFLGGAIDALNWSHLAVFLLEGVLITLTVSEVRRAKDHAEEKAREANRAIETRDAFLSMASHELKNPMTTLTLLLHHIRAAQRDPALLSGRLDEHFKTMDRTVSKLNVLVTNLLEISRISAHRLKLVTGPMDLGKVVELVADSFTPDAKAAGCELRLSVEPAVVGAWDKARVEQIVSNLLSNAIKYGKGHPIEIEVSQMPTHARVVVRDHGIGIEPEHRVRIFEPFERAVSSRQYGGLGLGLWVARNLATAMGGEIRVDSIPEKGSTFTVELPNGVA